MEADKKTTTEELGFFKKYGFYLALAVLAVIVMLPNPEGLSVAGQRMIGIMVFSVIVWATTAISYPVSAGVIMTLMALLIGFSPNPETGKLFGTAAGLGIGLKGFASTAFCLVAAAMFLAVAMTKTGLDKRIALVILSKLGAKSNRVVIGVILCGFILSFFVPSTTARVACLVPIVMGMIKAFDVPLKSKFAGMLMITVAQVDSVWNVGIKTAAAQNMVAVNFISSQLGVDISWLDWFVAAAPFSLLMSICLYKLMMHLMPPEIDEIKGGKETVARLLKEMGKVSVDEMKLLVISIFLLIFWTTEKKLHPIDTSTTTMVAVTLLLLPKIAIEGVDGFSIDVEDPKLNVGKLYSALFAGIDEPTTISLEPTTELKQDLKAFSFFESLKKIVDGACEKMNPSLADIVKKAEGLDVVDKAKRS